ncbi:PadR family transcriptional regulator [Rhodococcus sp. HNM0569]|uniref:PadR family transcriptional regulator n=1 Tax=Rhodococcus sp. HNM0569 TaxID=2716340 RepID=UPI00146D1C5F|nr:PadR family transcriptional regulator [Rhodococcus sp. HNM0569]NLU83266.1 PadR family transcriptional regulator [Rhodococcus sp. HNM0569]
MLTFGEELSGNDAKKWADWSVGFFYWSPSVSQVYSELKKLESLGLVRSRKIAEAGVRGRRVYAITPDGIAAVQAWSRDAPVEIPVLKHSVLLRIWMGHLSDPERLKELVAAHIDNIDDLRRRAQLHYDHSSREPSWSYPRLSLLWSVRYFEAEIDLARRLLDDIDDAAAGFAAVERTDAAGMPLPVEPGHWRSVEDVVRDVSAHERATGS